MIEPCRVRAVALVDGLRAEGDWLEVGPQSGAVRRLSLPAPRFDTMRPLTSAELDALEDRLKSLEATLDNTERLLGVYEGRLEPTDHELALLDSAPSRMYEILQEHIGPMRADFQRLEAAADEAWAAAGRPGAP